MKVALAALLLAGCIIEPPDSGDDYPSGGGWGSGWGGGSGTTGYGCHADTECGNGNVCARNGQCTAASAVRVVHTTWTLRDQEASDTSCANAPKLDITFSVDSGYDMFGFSPVPCDAGKYTIDKLPLRYNVVSLSRADDDRGGATASFDAQGNATINLPY